MATPPSRQASAVPASGNYTTTTSPKTSGTLPALQVGDVIVVVAGSEQAGTNATVTPSCSAGSVTWTLHTSQMAGTTNQSGEKLWYGTVGADAASGATISLARINTGTTLWWGFSATVWRGVSAIGAVIGGNSGTGNSIAQVTTPALQANSAVQVGINDWNASTITTPSWQTVNGAAMTGTLNITGASHATALGGYRDDVGTAGTKVVGLTTPATLRWVMVGIELVGASGSGFTGTVTLGGSGTLTLVGAVAASSAAALTGSGTLTAVGRPSQVSIVTLSGSGTLSSAGALVVVSSLPLSGAGTLTTAALPSQSSAASLSGAGSLSLSGTPANAGALTLSGSGSLSLAGKPGTTTTATMSGSGSLNLTSVPSQAASTNLNGSGSLAASGTPATVRAVGLSGSGTLSISTGTAGSSGANLTGSGALSASGAPAAVRTIILTGSGGLTASGSAGVSRTVSLTGAGTLNFAASAAARATTALAGSGLLTTDDSAAARGSAHLTGSGALVALMSFDPDFVPPELEAGPATPPRFVAAAARPVALSVVLPTVSLTAGPARPNRYGRHSSR